MARNRINNTGRNNFTNVNNATQSAVRHLGPKLRICQINVEGMSRAKGEYLSKFLAEMNINVLLAQETHTESNEELSSRGRIDGFELIVAEHSRAHGIATYVQQGMDDVNVVESATCNNVYSSVIRVGDFSITNVYKSPQATWSDPVLNIQPHPAIYAGDFNSHHTEWGYNTDDVNGEMVNSWSSFGELQLIYDPKDKKTFFSKIYHTETNPDLCFVSADSEGVPLQVSREVLHSFPNSQHRPVILEFGYSVPIIGSIPRPRWNFRKANWAQYSNLLDAAIRFIPPMPKNYNRFANLVISTAKKCIPRGYRKEYIPCWNEDSDRLYTEFQENEDPDTAKELLKSLDIARKERWINTVENIDLKRSSRQGWSLIRKLGGASKINKTKPKITADRIARRVVQSSKAPSNKVFSNKIIRAYRELRKKTPMDSELSAPFTVDDINLALMTMKNGKASGFDAIYPEFLTYCGPRTRLWLARFFTNVLRSNNVLPSLFKRTKIIALLKPGKPDDRPESYRPIALLSVTFKLYERLLHNRIVSEIEKVVPPEQAGFMKNRSCEEQVLALTNHIEDGFQRQLKTGVVFIDLTAAYDTVWKKGLLYKLIKIIPCLRIIDTVANMLTDRLFRILLNDQCSRFRKLNNGLAQGSVLSCLLFNLYTHDLPTSISRKFLYADDMAYAVQYKLFSEINKALSKDMSIFVRYCKEWRLVPNITKTVASCFHLNNKLAKMELHVMFGEVKLNHEFEPTYLGIKLDRSLTYGKHINKLRLKLTARNNLLRKLTGTSWGTSASCLRTTALALLYSCAEYCSSSWLNSAHSYKVDIELNKAMRTITGTVKSTPVEWLPALSNILPPSIRRQSKLLAMYRKILNNDHIPLKNDFEAPILQRLKSRHPAIATAKSLLASDFNPKEVWKEKWTSGCIGSQLYNFDNHTAKSKEFTLPRKLWCNLNRLRTGHGRCNEMLNKWNIVSDPSCTCGNQHQTMNHLLMECPIYKYNGPISDLLELNDQALAWLKDLNL